MKIVILSGAGISAESGLGTFRDADGLWEKYRIEDVATPEAWLKNPKLVLDFYNERRRQNYLAKPNLAHTALAELAGYFEVSIITQNIDNLHERAGSKNVLHLHGEITKAKTSELSNDYIDIEGDIIFGDLGPDGLQLRPHVVWFGESVPELEKAELLVRKADLLIIIGTSLKVYPAANLVHYAHENCKIVLIDPNEISIGDSGLISRIIKEKASIGVPSFIDFLIKSKST